MTQTSAVAGEVTQDIAGVSQSANEISIGSQQVHASAVDLSKIAEDLNQQVSRFRI